MKKPLLFAAVLAMFGATAAQAQSAGAPDCNRVIGEPVKNAFSEALKARVPDEDPGTFNQNTYDIKGIMSQDVGSSFSKLLNLDFGSILSGLVDKGVTRAVEKGQSNFSSRVNGILGKAGVSPETFNKVSNWGSSLQTPGFVPSATPPAPVQGYTAPAPVTPSRIAPVSPYSRPTAAPTATR